MRTADAPETDAPTLDDPATDTQTPDTQTPDTQWPCWEVFKQDGPGKLHQAVGSVHATDPQHALYTARSVFARRPAAVSLWAVPAAAVYALTREEMQQGEGLPDVAGEPQRYRVFGKKSHKRSMTFVDELGSLEADSPQAALEQARERYGDELLVWWIVPEAAFIGTPDDEQTVESWFAPARDKTYKQQSSYGVIGQHASKTKAPRPARADEHD